MRALTIDVTQSTGRILCSTVFRVGGKNYWRKDTSLVRKMPGCSKRKACVRSG